MQKRDIDFLFEMGSLRFINRAWRQFLGADFANLAEHTLRVIWISLAIAKNEKGVDLNKILKMALVHDIGESRTGDVDYVSRQYTERKESQAVSDILKDTSVEEDFPAIWAEYEERKTLEAKIVKDADNLDVELELVEQGTRGNPMPKKWYKMRNAVARQKLFVTKTGKKLYSNILKSDPDHWHLSAPNRFNAGDYALKKPKSSKPESK